jgi:hypothetical protein
LLAVVCSRLWARRLWRSWLIVWRARCGITGSITRGIPRGIAKFVSIARTFKCKAEAAVCISMLLPLSIDGRVIIIRTSSTPPLLRLHDLALPTIIMATFLFTGSFVLTLAHLFTLALLFFSLFSFPLFLLALLPVEAEECSSRAETTSCDLRSTREAAVALFLIIALALTAVVVSFAVAVIAVLSWTITVAVTIVIFVASAVLFTLRFLRMFAVAFGVLRIGCNVPAIAVGIARVPSSVFIASLKAVVTTTCTVPVFAVTSHSKASPRYTAIFVVPGRALSTFVVPRLTTIVVLLIVSFSRVVLVDSLSPTSVC